MGFDDWIEPVVGISALRENFDQDGGIEEPYLGTVDTVSSVWFL